MILQGALMELGAFLMLIPVVVFGLSADTISQHFSFSLPYFQENLVLMMVMSGIFGVARIIGAIGVLKNRMWGFVLSLINCTVTMILMVFLLPAGIVDGVFTVVALWLLLTGYYGKRKIV